MSTDSAADDGTGPAEPAAGADRTPPAKEAADASDGAAPGDAAPRHAGDADAAAAPPDADGLTRLDRAVLAVERRPWTGPGVKERVIRERLGLSPTRYYQVLNALLDDARALAHDPVTVNRLRRQRAARRQRR